MRTVNGKHGVIVALMTLIGVCAFVVLPCFAQQDQGGKGGGPDRSFAMYFDYPEIILPGGSKKVDLNLSFNNKGKQDETIYFNYQILVMSRLFKRVSNRITNNPCYAD